MALLCPAFLLVFSHFGDALFPAYRTFTKALLGAQAALASVAPVALWDFLVVALAIAAVVSFAARIVRKRSILAWLSTVLCVLAATAFLFVGGWAVNHYAPPLSRDLDLDVEQYSTEQLVEACIYYYQQAARLADQVPRDDEDNLVAQDFFELARIAGGSYANLAGRYPVFEGSTAPVKALVLAGDPLLYSGHVGIFFSPTGESSVPLHCAPSEMPFTMCHEAAHRLGIASEEEANFAAILACAANDDTRFKYAAYYLAFCYCHNALSSHSPDIAQQIVDLAAESSFADGARLIATDRYATYLHYLPYEGPAKETGTQVNDTYLKTFGEEVGVQSYGLVVDYLIAWYVQNAPAKS